MSENKVFKTLYIIRHGETDFNRQNIVQGSGVDTDLNDTGRAQAAAFFSYYGKYRFDKVYTSALKRTMQSVAEFIEMGIAHEQLAELNEICWGDFEGKQQTEEQRQVYRDTVNRWNSGELDLSVANGETPLEMQARQRIAVQKILARGNEENVLICMHGRAMKSLLCLLTEEPLEQMEKFQHVNLCLYLVEYDGRKFKLVKSNDVTHLVNLRTP